MPIDLRRMPLLVLLLFALPPLRAQDSPQGSQGATPTTVDTSKPGKPLYFPPKVPQSPLPPLSHAKENQIALLPAAQSVRNGSSPKPARSGRPSIPSNAGSAPHCSGVELEGSWNSDPAFFGVVTFKDVKCQPDGSVTFFVSWRGALESGRSEPAGTNGYQPGVYNPKTGELSFRYVQISFNGTDQGKAQFKSFDSATKIGFTGSYLHQSGKTGLWTVWRENSNCPLTSEEIADSSQQSILNLIKTHDGCRALALETSCGVLSGIPLAELTAELPAIIAQLTWATGLILAIEEAKPARSPISLDRDLAVANSYCENSSLHRGRFQAQGGKLEASVAWAQPIPLTLADCLAKLEELKNRLPTKERIARQNAFEKARKQILRFAQQGGYRAPPAYANSFVETPGSDIRVDIEIRSGLACVP
jgi:hypothetical protein